MAFSRSTKASASDLLSAASASKPRRCRAASLAASLPPLALFRRAFAAPARSMSCSSPSLPGLPCQSTSSIASRFSFMKAMADRSASCVSLSFFARASEKFSKSSSLGATGPSTSSLSMSSMLPAIVSTASTSCSSCSMSFLFASSCCRRDSSAALFLASTFCINWLIFDTRAFASSFTFSASTRTVRGSLKASWTRISSTSAVSSLMVSGLASRSFCSALFSIRCAWCSRFLCSASNCLRCSNSTCRCSASLSRSSMRRREISSCCIISSNSFFLLVSCSPFDSTGGGFSTFAEPGCRPGTEAPFINLVTTSMLESTGPSKGHCQPLEGGVCAEVSGWKAQTSSPPIEGPNHQPLKSGLS
mmetsp:Transcript_65659/g.145869  ORF Transcript_65659/g.145869 Transcript_65659/m.145869 type:complete len:361 (-) Transcript_65659:135-1217(-)